MCIWHHKLSNAKTADQFDPPLEYQNGNLIHRCTFHLHSEQYVTTSRELTWMAGRVLVSGE